MRNAILDEIISDVIDRSNQPQEFKSTFKKYIQNKFDGNADDKDLKTVWDMIEGTEEEPLV